MKGEKTLIFHSGSWLESERCRSEYADLDLTTAVVH